MREGEATGLMACGLLDFQDAQWGSPAYDLVSLLQDVRHHVDETLQAELKNRYVKKMGFDPLVFDRECQILGLQRAAHIYGIFAKYLVGGTRHHLQAYLPRAAYLMRSSLVFSWAGPWKTYLEKLDSRLGTGTNLSTTLHIL